jgi:hypothetical protein
MKLYLSVIKIFLTTNNKYLLHHVINIMNNIQKRFLLFLVFCIGLRSLAAYIAKTIDPKYLPILGYIALIPAVGFAYLYLTDSRKTGGETFNQKIWWTDLRPIHACLYLCFFLYAIKKSEYAWIVLVVDVMIGLTSFLIYHYISDDFTKL